MPPMTGICLTFVVENEPDTMLIDVGADLATVQKLAGHSQANTIAGYDWCGERARRDAVGRAAHVMDEERVS